LENSAPAYAVTVKKPKFKKWNNEEQRNAHRNALTKIMDKVAQKERASSIHMIIDENNKAKRGTVEYLAGIIAAEHKKTITFEIARSKDNFACRPMTLY